MDEIIVPNPSPQTFLMSLLISAEGCVLGCWKSKGRTLAMRRKEKETELRFEETRRCSQKQEGKRKQVKGVERIRGKGKGEKERESGKGVGDDGVEFRMIESERSEDLDSVVAVFRDDDVVVLIDCHSRWTAELTRI